MMPAYAPGALDEAQAARNEAQERTRCMNRLAELRNARSSYEALWRDLAQNIAPRRSRFFTSEVETAGQKKEQYILNGTPTWALRTLAAGMMAGIASPAREWFRLSPQDPDAAEDEEVKEYLHESGARELDVMGHSNFYNALAQLLEDLGLIGTAVMVIEDDEEDVIRAYLIPVGEYFLATSERGVVDTLYHLTRFTVGQLVRKFGKAKCSPRVQGLFASGHLDAWVEVLHVIEPREDYDERLAGPLNMPFSSCWFETEGGTGLLKESGYNENPILAPRWSVTGNEVYGSSPAMQTLGDCRSLQLYEKHGARVAELVVDPPMNGHVSMKAQGASMLPGARNYLTGASQGQAFEPAIEVNPSAVQVIDGKISRIEARVKTGLLSDLWLMMQEQGEEGGQPITAREVQERHEEKMLQLGPVMERLETELLNPAVFRILSILFRRRLLPKPPKRLQGQKLRVEYRSIMAQAQRSVEAAGIQQVVQFLLSLVEAKPDILDKVDLDAMVAKLAEAVGVAPALINSDERVQQLRSQRAQAVAQQQQAQQALAATQGAKNLGQANTGGSNLLSQMVGGPAAAQVGGLQ